MSDITKETGSSGQISSPRLSIAQKKNKTFVGKSVSGDGFKQNKKNLGEGDVALWKFVVKKDRQTDQEIRRFFDSYLSVLYGSRKSFRTEVISITEPKQKNLYISFHLQLKKSEAKHLFESWSTILEDYDVSPLSYTNDSEGGVELGYSISKRGDQSPDTKQRNEIERIGEPEQWIFYLKHNFGNKPEVSEMKKEIRETYNNDMRYYRWKEFKNPGLIWFTIIDYSDVAQALFKKWGGVLQAYDTYKEYLKWADEPLEFDDQEMPVQDIDTSKDYSFLFNVKNPVEKRETAVRESTREEVRVLSWGPGTTLDPTRFFFDRRQGKGVIVFVIDNGFNLSHTDFDHMTGRLNYEVLEWNGDDTLVDLYKGSQHGSRVLSKIVGKKNGAARLAYPILVNLGRSGEVIDAIETVYNKINDIRVDFPKTKFIINMSISFGKKGTPGSPEAQPHEEVEASLKRIINIPNVLITCSSGNMPYRTPIIRTPATLGETERKIVVVGGADEITYDYARQNEYWVRVHSLSEYVEVVAPEISKTAYWERTGTSYAAPAVAGVAAALWSKYPQFSAEQLISEIENLAWRRNPNGPPIVYNGEGPPPVVVVATPVLDVDHHIVVETVTQTACRLQRRNLGASENNLTPLPHIDL